MPDVRQCVLRALHGAQRVPDGVHAVSGSYIGVWRHAAKRAGLTLDEYLARRDAGDRWCGACFAFHQLAAFGSDRSRPEGRRPICRDAYNRQARARYGGATA